MDYIKDLLVTHDLTPRLELEIQGRGKHRWNFHRCGCKSQL